MTCNVVLIRLTYFTQNKHLTVDLLLLSSFFSRLSPFKKENRKTEMNYWVKQLLRLGTASRRVSVDGVVVVLRPTLRVYQREVARTVLFAASGGQLAPPHRRNGGSCREWREVSRLCRVPPHEARRGLPAACDALEAAGNAVERAVVDVLVNPGPLGNIRRPLSTHARGAAVLPVVPLSSVCTPTRGAATQENAAPPAPAFPTIQDLDGLFVGSYLYLDSESRIASEKEIKAALLKYYTDRRIRLPKKLEKRFIRTEHLGRLAKEIAKELKADPGRTVATSVAHQRFAMMFLAMPTNLEDYPYEHHLEEQFDEARDVVADWFPEGRPREESAAFENLPPWAQWIVKDKNTSFVQKFFRCCVYQFNQVRTWSLEQRLDDIKKTCERGGTDPYYGAVLSSASDVVYSFGLRSSQSNRLLLTSASMSLASFDEQCSITTWAKDLTKAVLMVSGESGSGKTLFLLRRVLAKMVEDHGMDPQRTRRVVVYLSPAPLRSGVERSHPDENPFPLNTGELLRSIKKKLQVSGVSLVDVVEGRNLSAKQQEKLPPLARSLWAIQRNSLADPVVAKALPRWREKHCPVGSFMTLTAAHKVLRDFVVYTEVLECATRALSTGMKPTVLSLLRDAYVEGKDKHTKQPTPPVAFLLAVDEVGADTDLSRGLCVVREDLQTALLGTQKVPNKNFVFAIAMAGTGLSESSVAPGSENNMFTSVVLTKDDQKRTLQAHLEQRSVSETPTVMELVRSNPFLADAMGNRRLAALFAVEIKKWFPNTNTKQWCPATFPVLQSALLSAVREFKERNALQSLDQNFLFDSLTQAVALHLFPYEPKDVQARCAHRVYFEKHGTLRDAGSWNIVQGAVDETRTGELYAQDATMKGFKLLTSVGESRYDLSLAMMAILSLLVFGFTPISSVSGKGLEQSATLSVMMMVFSTLPLKASTYILRHGAPLTPSGLARLAPNSDHTAPYSWESAVAALGAGTDALAVVNQQSPEKMEDTFFVRSLLGSSSEWRKFIDQAQQSRAVVFGAVSPPKSSFADAVVCVKGERLVLIQSKDLTQPLELYELFAEFHKMGHRGRQSIAGYCASTLKADPRSDVWLALFQMAETHSIGALTAMLKSLVAMPAEEIALLEDDRFSEVIDAHYANLCAQQRAEQVAIFRGLLTNTSGLSAAKVEALRGKIKIVLPLESIEMRSAEEIIAQCDRQRAQDAKRNELRRFLESSKKTEGGNNEETSDSVPRLNIFELLSKQPVQMLQDASIPVKVRKDEQDGAETLKMLQTDLCVPPAKTLFVVYCTRDVVPLELRRAVSDRADVWHIDWSQLEDTDVGIHVCNGVGFATCHVPSNRFLFEVGGEPIDNMRMDD